MNGIQPGTVSNQNSCMTHIKTADAGCNREKIPGAELGERSVKGRKRQILLLDPPSLLTLEDALEQTRRLQGEVTTKVRGHEVQRQFAWDLATPG